MPARRRGAGTLGFSARGSTLPKSSPVPSGRDVRLTLGPALGWMERLTGGIVPGGSYLLAGSPGAGKSRLATQIAIGLALSGTPSVTALTEEAEDRHAHRVNQLAWNFADRESPGKHIRVTSAVRELSDLPYALPLAGPNSLGDTKVVILDSIQGDGMPAGAFAEYQALYDFCRHCREQRIATLLLGHVNKRGQIAGPKGLEHAVDAVWRIERAGPGRLFAVTKNRFGAEHPRGIYLETDPLNTALSPSPHASPVTGVARTYLGPDAIVAELQARVSLPTPGVRPTVAAPGLPKKRIEQIVSAVSELPILDVGALDLSVNAMVPGDAGFRAWMALPLAVALFSSIVRRTVPAAHIYLGEIDLDRAIRTVPEAVTSLIVDSAQAGHISPEARIFCAPGTVALLDGVGLDLVAVSTLDEAIDKTFGDLD